MEVTRLVDMVKIVQKMLLTNGRSFVVLAQKDQLQMYQKM